MGAFTGFNLRRCSKHGCLLQQRDRWTEGSSDGYRPPTRITEWYCPKCEEEAARAAEVEAARRQAELEALRRQLEPKVQQLLNINVESLRTIEECEEVLRELEELQSGDNYWAVEPRYRRRLEELTMAVLSRKSALKKQKEQEEAERLFREMLSRREVLVLGSPFADLPEEREDRWLPLTAESLKLAIARAVGNKPLKAALERLKEVVQ